MATPKPIARSLQTTSTIIFTLGHILLVTGSAHVVEERDLAGSMPEKTEEMKKRLFDVWKEIETEGPDHWWKNERQKPVRGGKVNY